VEYRPRTCVGNSVAELQTITSRFDAKHVGICFDVNHIMDRYRELPDMITELAPRIRTFHISDYDGIDEMHWFAGQGIIQWNEVMAAIKEIPYDVLLISETMYQLGTKVSHIADPYFAIRQTEDSFFFLENCKEIMQAREKFRKSLA
jgi:hexosaminidase